MRKILGAVLVGLGGFLLVAGVMGLIWAPGAVKKTPIEVNTITYLDGNAAKYDASTGELVENPIYAISDTRTDTEVSTDEVNAWVSSTCVMVDRGGERACVDGSKDMITASVDVFATDRVTGLAVNEGIELPADAEEREGLVNKWPFDAEKKTYPYWDDTTGEAVDAVYDRTEDLQGTEVYVYAISITDAPVDVAPKTPGTYTTNKEIWVEPRTGAILNQVEDQQRYLEDGTQVLDLQLAFTDDQLDTSVADNESDRRSLTLLTTVVPLVGLIGGALALVVGLLLLLRGRGRAGTTADKREGALVGARR